MGVSTLNDSIHVMLMNAKKKESNKMPVKGYVPRAQHPGLCLCDRDGGDESIGKTNATVSSRGDE